MKHYKISQDIIDGLIKLMYELNVPVKSYDSVQAILKGLEELKEESK